MSMLQKFAKLLGIPQHQAEDALHSDRAAQAVLSRRNLFAAAGSLAAGTVLVPGADLYVNPWDQVGDYGNVLRAMIKVEGLADSVASAVGWGEIWFHEGAAEPRGDWETFNIDAQFEIKL